MPRLDFQQHCSRRRSAASWAAAMRSSRVQLRERPSLRTDQRVAFRRLPLLSKPTAYLALAQLTGTVLTKRLEKPTGLGAHQPRRHRKTNRFLVACAT